MKIIISPAKNMIIRSDDLFSVTTPVFLKQTKKLYGYLKKMNVDELKQVLQANDQIVWKHYLNYQHFDFNTQLTPAIACFQGIQYTSISPMTFTNQQWEYVKNHVYILSAFYGVLNALDGIKPYRLEMVHPFLTDQFTSLYDFWKDQFYQELYRNEEVVLNLCSDEYSKMVRPYVKANQKFVTVTFYEQENQKLRQKTVYLKMARGLMVRFLAEHQIEEVEEVKKFSMLGYQYHEELSSKSNFVFVRKEKKKCYK